MLTDSENARQNSVHRSKNRRVALKCTNILLCALDLFGHSKNEHFEIQAALGGQFINR